MLDQQSDRPPLPVNPFAYRPQYTSGYTQGRPGAIGFIGVTSIVMGCLGMLAGVCFGFMDYSLVMTSSAMSKISVVPPAKVVPTAERVPSNGLRADLRKTVSDGLCIVTPLNPQQLPQLDELLAEHGQTVVPGADGLSPQQISATVSSHGHTDYAGSFGSDYFVLGGGRLEVAEDRAVFFPSDGQLAVRANAILLPANPYTTNSPASALTPDQIQSVIRTITDLSGGGIKNAQMKSLVDTLQNPGEQFVVPTTDGTDPAWQITSARLDPDGTLNLLTTHGSVTETLSFDASGSNTESTTTNSVVAGKGMKFPAISGAAGRTALSLTGFQFLLSIYLLVIGILTLGNNPHGRMLHWIYVGVKLPLAVATAFASAWMWRSLFGSMPSAGAASNAFVYGGNIPIAFACIYPVALIFVLMSRGVRDFYAPADAGWQ